MSQCYHIWGTGGLCIKPGCRTRRQPESPGSRPHPLATSEERRARVVELLPTHSNRAIGSLLRMSEKTIRRIRSQAAEVAGEDTLT